MEDRIEPRQTVSMASPPRRSRRRWWAVLVIIVLLASGGYAWYRHQATDAGAAAFRVDKVVRGPMTAQVSASGTLNAVVSVQVGSQVSGQIKEVLADFNAEVKQGQLIARLDPETFESRLRQSEADVDAANAQLLTAQAGVSAARAALARARVSLADAKRDLERKEMLVERQFISPAELDKARALYNIGVEDVNSASAQLGVTEAQVGSARANVKQREAQRQQARIDLERTAIRAPVNGVVIKRSVDAGQTVAASLQAPELFIIARDLRDMQVDTSIDEAEIGKVRVGQRATFTVDSFPGRSFSGEVRQVRKAALNVQNVVTYTVVVSAPNPDLTLLPGMTANVRIVTDTRDAVLKVPNAALRFRPPDFQEPAATAPSASSAAPTSAPQAGGPLVRFRERIDRELAPSPEQTQQLDAIFGAMRERFAAARSVPEADRAKTVERARAELRERIAGILTPAQKQRYAELVAEATGRASTRGRVFVLAADGRPRAIEVRLGLSDGSYTEVSGGALKEGDSVITGSATTAGNAQKATPSGPRLPF